MARGHLRIDRGYYTGKTGPGDDTTVAQFPFPITREVLDRGRQRYDIYCSPCHSRVGDGQGMIVQRGFSKPPPFVIPPNVEEKEAIEKGEPNRWARTTFLQTAPPRHIYNAISNGFGGMYSYGERVAPRDRWAIAAYVKALQSTPPEVAAKPHTRPSAEKPETH